MKKLNVLCSDINPIHLEVLRNIVIESGHNVDTVSSASEVLQKNLSYNVIIIEYLLRDEVNSNDFIEMIKQQDQDTLIILISKECALLEDFPYQGIDQIQLIFKDSNTPQTICNQLQEHQSNLVDKQSLSCSAV